MLIWKQLTSIEKDVWWEEMVGTGPGQGARGFDWPVFFLPLLSTTMALRGLGFDGGRVGLLCNRCLKGRADRSWLWLSRLWGD